MSLLTLEKRGHVAILTLNRPEAMNALGAPGDGDQVQAVCEQVNADREIRCVDELNSKYYKVRSLLYCFFIHLSFALLT